MNLVVKLLTTFLLPVCYLLTQPQLVAQTTTVPFNPSRASVVALHGQILPGGDDFSLNDDVSVNEEGQVVFVDRSSGVYFYESGVISVVLERQVPGFSDFLFSFGDPQLRGNGDIVVAARGSMFPGPETSEIFAVSGSSLSSVVSEGESAPGTSGKVYSRIRNAKGISNDGSFLFSTFLRGEDDPSIGDFGIFGDFDIFGDLGIFLSGPGGVVPLVIDGTNAVGTSSAFSIDAFNLSVADFLINNAGDVAYELRLEANDNTTRDGIWVHRDGITELVALTNDLAPGTTAIFANFRRSAVLHPDGFTSFVAELEGAGINSTNDSGIWTESAAGLELVVRAGDSYSDSNFNALLEGSFRIRDVNTQGDMIFSADLLDESNNRFIGLFLKRPGHDIEALVTTRDELPGLNLSSQWSVLGIDADINELGELAIRMSIHNRDGGFNSDGIWVLGLDGELRLVVNGFQNVFGVREIEFLDILGFNDDGLLTFQFDYFSSGSAIAQYNTADTEPLVLLGDCNSDGTVNFLDIPPFISTLSTPGYLAAADIDQNGVVNFLDISHFIILLSI